MKNLFNNDKVDIKNLNKIISAGSRIMQILLILLCIICIYAITLIFKEWKILSFILTILKILSPFFVGLIIAWLLAPCVNFLHKKGINRVLGTTLTYVCLLGLLFIFVNTVFPLLLNEINNFIKSLPNIVKDIVDWSNKMLNRLRGVSFINISNIKADISDSFDQFVKSFSTKTPGAIVAVLKQGASAIWVFILGLMIGFYLLFDFNGLGKAMLNLLPKKFRHDIQSLFKEVDSSLFMYIKGMLIISSTVTVLCGIAFFIAGLKGALLLALICGITNFIPYIGPYLGVIPAAIVGFSQSTATGIATVIIVLIVHFVEGNFVHPLIMSKTMNLHPVTIIIGLLVFGYFFGIVGMIIATPLIAMIKSVAIFFENKFGLFKYSEEE